MCVSFSLNRKFWTLRIKRRSMKRKEWLWYVMITSVNSACHFILYSVNFFIVYILQLYRVLIEAFPFSYRKFLCTIIRNTYYFYHVFFLIESPFNAREQQYFSTILSTRYCLREKLLLNHIIINTKYIYTIQISSNFIIF